MPKINAAEANRIVSACENARPELYRALANMMDESLSDSVRKANVRKYGKLINAGFSEMQAALEAAQPLNQKGLELLEGIKLVQQIGEKLEHLA